MTKTEIVKETIEYYSKNPRSISAGGCKYLTSLGDMCAFGRCCTPEAVKLLNSRYESMNVMALSRNEIIDDLLKPEYRGHDIQFWVSIQRLHDGSLFWKSDNTLSEQGINYVNDNLTFND